MPKPFFQLSVEQFYLLLDYYPLSRTIDSVHMHHTWAPNRSQYAGESTINAIYEAHLARGFVDIAEHVTIAPDGTIWTGRDWNLPPASAIHFNGTSRSGPFMFETIGDFDLGHDPFDGIQRDTVLGVLAHLLTRFNLPLDQILFHNQMTSAKSCPGTSIRRSEILQDVATLLSAGETKPSPAGNPPATSIGTADIAFVREVIISMTRNLPAPREISGELDYDFEAKASFLASASPQAALMDFETRDVTAQSSPPPADLQLLRPYAINMRWGKFADGDGHLLQTTPGDVDAIVQQYLPAELNSLADGEYLDILLYAHGGLVSEADGLKEALTALPFFRDNKIYPLFFIWETGLWETIKGLITGQVEAETRDLAGIADAIRNKAIEFAAHYVLPGPTLWGGMKGDADKSSAPNGAAFYFAQGLQKFFTNIGEKSAARVRLHAVGHSAGAIFHSHLLPALFGMGSTTIQTMHLLAPAIRIDAYEDSLAGLIPDRIKDVTMYTMVKPRELADTCQRIYGHSLLYLIRNALEDVVSTPILGLEENIRKDQSVANQFGLSGTTNPNARIIWSPTKANTGIDASQSICHGGFHNDPATMGSLVRRVKQWPATQVIDEFPNLGNICPDAGNSRALLPTSFGERQADYRSTGSISTRAGGTRSSSTTRASQASNAGQRLAVCVGIDQYPSPNTLTGCVADALAWQASLSSLGFSVKTLLDGAATFDGIVGALTDLISNGSAGDTLILQYSGHGTEVPNPNRQAGDGELAGEDEAFVPVDFQQQGGFLIDRQVRSILDKLADGAQLTCFIDCCHSATISRMAIGAASLPPGNSVHGRFIPFTAVMARAYQDFQARTVSSSIYPPGIRSNMRHVVFSACRAEEVAYERNGRGDFSRLTIPLLSTSNISNSDFQKLIEQAFGPNPSQHPVLDCADPWASQSLFSFNSLRSQSSSQPGRQFSLPSGTDLDLGDLARRLRGLADLIG